MTDSATIEGDSLDRVVVLTARYLVITFLGVWSVDRLGIVRVERYVPFKLFFWIVVVLSAVAVGIVLRPVAEMGYRWIRQAFRASHAPSLKRWLSAVTRNLVVALVGLTAAAHVFVPVGVHVDLGILYLGTLVTLATTLLLRDDARATMATRVGAAAVAGLLLLQRLPVPALPEADVSTYALATLLLVVLSWKEPVRSPASVGFVDRLNARHARLGVTVLLAAAAVIYFYRLGSHEFHGDEHQVVDAAAGFYHTGGFHLWNWIADRPRPETYTRAAPHTATIAVSYALFGISEWSARLPSALAGVATVPISYGVFAYFTERRWVAAVTTAAVVAYPSLVGIFRWTRMYALLVPLFLLLSYLVCRTLTEENPLDLRNDRANEFVDEYLNFNLGLGLVTLPVLGFASILHVNSLYVVVAGYLFVLYRTFETKERRYVVATVAGLGGLVAVAAIVRYTGYLDFIPAYLSFFGEENRAYVDLLLRYPFGATFGGLLAVVGFVVVRTAEDGRLRTKMTFLYVLVAFSLVFLVYIGDRYVSYAYIVHVVPLGIALTLYGFRSVLDDIGSRTIRSLLVVLLVATIATPMVAGSDGESYRTLYFEEDQDFRTAYETIERSYDPATEALIVQYPRRYYLRDLPANATIVNMESDREYTPTEFRRDLRKYEAGWVAWESGKSYHIRDGIRAYIEEHFVQYHGEGVDDTRVEVYYFNETMVDDGTISEMGG